MRATRPLQGRVKRHVGRPAVQPGWRLQPSLLHWPCEAVSRVRSHISPGPYRSFRELSLAGSVDPDIWCPPTFVGNSGIERSNGHRGFALLSCCMACRHARRLPGHSRLSLEVRGMTTSAADDLESPALADDDDAGDDAWLNRPMAPPKPISAPRRSPSATPLSDEQRAAAAQAHRQTRTAVRIRARRGRFRLFADPQRDSTRRR